MVHIYIYIFYLSTFLKLVGLTLISCCFAFVQNSPCKKWGQIYGWRSGGSACLKQFVRDQDGKIPETPGGSYWKQQREHIIFIYSKYRSDSLLLSSAAYMYFTNTSLWAVAGRNVIPAECEWLYLPIVRWHFQEIIRSSWNNSVPIV